MGDDKPSDSLGRALGDIRRGATEPRRAAKPWGTQSEGFVERPALEQILAGTFRGDARDAAARPLRTSAGLVDLARQAHAGRTASRAAAEDSRKRLPFAVAILGFLFLLAVVLDGREDQAPEPQAVSFEQQLERLGEALDAYKAREGHLPASLSLLPEFPPDALEWPFTHYRLRVLEDRPEFFLVPEAVGGYVLIGRYRGEAWMYTEASRRPLHRLRSI